MGINLGRILSPEELHLENVAVQNVLEKLVTEWLWTNLQSTGGKIGEPHSINDMASKTLDIKNEDLFYEAIEWVDDEYVIKEGDKLKFKKPAPTGTTVNYLLNKEPARDFAETYAVFIDFVHAGMDKLLLGTVKHGHFDPSAWEKVLGGSFYANSRRREMEYGGLAEFLKARESTPKILDFGCGTGHSLLQVQAYLESRGIIDYEFYGYDPSPGMVEMAQNRIPSLQPYVLGDPTNTIQFDVVLAFFCHHFIPPEQQRPTMALFDQIIKSPGKFLGIGGFCEVDYNPAQDPLVKLIGGAGSPSEEFKSWFTGTSFEVNVNTFELVFCCNK
ncbi:MAG: class I SAM-dependent methyltransferase [Candidatus Hodarchaeota archaeon]